MDTIPIPYDKTFSLQSVTKNDDNTYKIILSSMMDNRPVEIVYFRCKFASINNIDTTKSFANVYLGFTLLVGEADKIGEIVRIEVTD